MQTLTEILVREKMAGRVITDARIARFVDGSPQRRYNLVNRAVKAGELVILRRGTYLLSGLMAERYPHPFVIAQAIRPGSFVSMESALGFHGLIPEAVPMTLSVAPGRRTLTVTNDLVGRYKFVPLALRRGHFLEGVGRYEFSLQHALVAEPLRAMLDIVAMRRLEPAAMTDFVASMRIDLDELGPVEPGFWEAMSETYLHIRMRRCIEALREELRQ